MHHPLHCVSSDGSRWHVVCALQVYGKVFEAIIALVSRTSALVKRPGFVVIGGLVDKLSDSKLKGLAFDTLTALSEAISPQFVCTQLHKKAAAHKSPKVSMRLLSCSMPVIAFS